MNLVIFKFLNINIIKNSDDEIDFEGLNKVDSNEIADLLFDRPVIEVDERQVIYSFQPILPLTEKVTASPKVNQGNRNLTATVLKQKAKKTKVFNLHSSNLAYFLRHSQMTGEFLQNLFTNLKLLLILRKAKVLFPIRRLTLLQWLSITQLNHCRLLPVHLALT